MVMSCGYGMLPLKSLEKAGSYLIDICGGEPGKEVKIDPKDV